MAPIPRTLHCQTCSKRFPNQRELTEHKSSSRHRCPCTGCKLASSSCFTGEGLYAHMKLHHDDMVCTFCNMTFETSVGKRIHDQMGVFKCSDCPHLDFCRKEAFEAHLRTSWAHAKTWCMDCCNNYSSHQEYVNHICHPVDRTRTTPLYDCKICGLSELTAFGMKEHKYWYHRHENSFYDEELHFDAFGSRTPPKVESPPKERPKQPERPTFPCTRPLPMGLYTILGVDPSSSHQEIQRAAKQQRINCHPDKLKKIGMSDSELREIDKWAKEVGGAAEVLLDPTKRAQYDRWLGNSQRSRAS